jgi:hypothetical protein
MIAAVLASHSACAGRGIEAIRKNHTEELGSGEGAASVGSRLPTKVAKVKAAAIPASRCDTMEQAAIYKHTEYANDTSNFPTFKT